MSIADPQKCDESRILSCTLADHSYALRHETVDGWRRVADKKCLSIVFFSCSRPLHLQLSIFIHFATIAYFLHWNGNMCDPNTHRKQIFALLSRSPFPFPNCLDNEPDLL